MTFVTVTKKPIFLVGTYEENILRVYARACACIYKNVVLCKMISYRVFSYDYVCALYANGSGHSAGLER